ncbi:MAG: hypothetical protein RIC03_06820 [Cyclobacteriaceae bacterium]
MTHTANIRKQMSQTKLQIQNILQWTDQQYADFQYEQGVIYIQELCGAPDAVSMADHLIRHSEIWSWWRLMWYKRDLTFLEESTTLFRGEHSIYYKEITHCTSVVKYFPHQELLEESYHSMMHSLIKEKVK